MSAGGPRGFNEYLSSIPIITKALLGINIVIHILIFVSSASLNNFAISAHLVWNDSEYYRIISAAFVHGGIMHIAMNMSSLLQLGHSLENQFGSLQFLFLTSWSVLVIGIFYVILSWLLAYSLSDSRQLYSSGVGFSGVLFCYALLESFHSTEVTRSIFGIVNVPAKMYPFILLILIQVVLPNISFIGHASGLLVGLLTVFGFMQVVLPSLEFLESLEAVPCVSHLTTSSGYVRQGTKSFVYSSGGSGSSGGAIAALNIACNTLCCCLTQILNAISTVFYIVGCPVDRVSAYFLYLKSKVLSSMISVSTFCKSLFNGRGAATSGGGGGGIGAGAGEGGTGEGGDEERGSGGGVSMEFGRLVTGGERIRYMPLPAIIEEGKSNKIIEI